MLTHPRLQLLVLCALALAAACRQPPPPVAVTPPKPLMPERAKPVAQPLVAAPQPAVLAQAVPAAPSPLAERTWQVLLPWGKGPLQVGRSAPQEGNPEAPSSFALDTSGQIWILDQLNQRVVVLKVAADGLPQQAREPISVSATAQDLAVTADGQTLFVVDRLVARQLDVLALQEPFAHRIVSLRPDSLPNSAGITAIFARPDGVWLEYEHADLRRVATLDGVHADPLTLHGRPNADGNVLISAQKVPPAQVLVSWHAAKGEAKSAALASATVQFSPPVLAIAGLDATPAGGVWLTVDLAPDATKGASRVAVLLDAAGHEVQRAELLVPDGPQEQLRTTTVGADGAFYSMARSAEGLHIERWAR